MPVWQFASVNSAFYCTCCTQMPAWLVPSLTYTCIVLCIIAETHQHLQVDAHHAKPHLVLQLHVKQLAFA